jgi:hypothetical protein
MYATLHQVHNQRCTLLYELVLPCIVDYVCYVMLVYCGCDIT